MFKVRLCSLGREFEWHLAWLRRQRATLLRLTGQYSEDALKGLPDRLVAEIRANPVLQDQLAELEVIERQIRGMEARGFQTKMVYPA